MTLPEARWMDTKEVATRTRKALKLAFPRTKFSVTLSRYSMGSSVSVSWTDGPSVKQAEAVYGPLDFYQFDGMQDLRSTADARMIDGERVRSSCSFSPRREHSEAAVLQAISAARTCNHAGVDADTLSVGGSAAWGYSVQSSEANTYDHWSAWGFANRALQESSEYAGVPVVIQVQPDLEAEARQAAAFAAIKAREAVISADICKIEAAFAGTVEASQRGPGQYCIYSRRAVRSSGAFLAEGTVAELLELATEAADLLAPLRLAKPRLRVWSDGTIMHTPELYALPAERLLN